MTQVFNTDPFTQAIELPSVENTTVPSPESKPIVKIKREVKPKRPLLKVTK